VSGQEREARALLDDLAAAGVAVHVEGGKLLRRAGSPLVPDDLRERLGPLRGAIVAILWRPGPAWIEPGTGEVSRLHYPTQGPVASWEGPDAALVAWVEALTPGDLPPFPFELRPGVTVNGPQALASWQADTRQGPRGPRARTGVLQRDLENLREAIARAALTGTAHVDKREPGASRKATRRVQEPEGPRGRGRATPETG
jgi:hypothetical protein